MGEHPDRSIGLGTSGRRRVAQGLEPPVPPDERRRGHRAPDRRYSSWAVPVAGRRPMLLAGGGLRRSGRDVGRAVLPEGCPSARGTRHIGGIPIRVGRPRVDLLHRSGAGGDCPGTGLRVAAGGDRVTWTHGLVQLRPAIPLPGRSSDLRQCRQPHRRAVAGNMSQGRRNGLPRCGHAGTARGPMGLSIQPGPVVNQGGRAARRPGRHGAGRYRRGPAHAGDRDTHQAAGPPRWCRPSCARASASTPPS